MIERFHHYALVVPNLEDAITWYQDVLAFRLERQFEFADAKLRIAHIITDSGVRLELLEQDGSVPSPDVGRDAFTSLYTQGAKHVGFQVADLDATATALQQRGIPFVHPITVVEPAGVRNFWIRDTAGNLIEMVQPLS
jgi:catechol 2,3-dioxygenase-like lactoylglutathione lyase family enzyme